ncbi:tetratricopeptide repeat protein [Aeoliella sp. ICT_H6.2]|uniref:Tetratricopeptide repeat protein n=1 Tax=Aeoliella straminimaris TaxID=2954799 RepID=A0A9X2FCW2_9BACT|nr:tetratricopeptide repeat protein [Aeoliella straminimaris]MCO6045888.1 tetratricopeptide repeat protein [Aeoliella straminimaris]
MENYQFKFKWLNDQGQPQGFYSKKGHFDGETLVLDTVDLPSAAILDVDYRERTVILSVVGENSEPVHLLFNVTSGSADRLKLMLGRARSRAWARRHKEELASEGRSSEYRDVTCPHCHAVIDLSGFAKTPQVSCEFCHTVSDDQSESFDAPAKGEKKYRLCDECGMFSKPRRFTIFYFYFLLVVYGFSHRQTWRCPGCMRSEAWKMLLGNAIFVLGVPVAIAQLFRAYGGTDVGGKYPGLDSANIKARNGKFQQAIDDYRKILDKQPVAAGVKYNIAMAFLHREDWEGAARMFQYSLTDCANYRPSARGLAACYEHLGETEKLAALKKQWGAKDDEVLLEELPEE